MKSLKLAAWLLGLAAMSLSAALAQPGGLPLENHYKVYLSTPISLTKTVVVEDQFGVLEIPNLIFDRHATPASKDDSPVYDATAYQGYLNGLQLGKSSDAALFVRRVCPVPSAFIT